MEILEATGRFEMAIRAVRVFGEGNRRAAEAAMGVYDEVVAELGAEFLGLPPEEGYRGPRAMGPVRPDRAGARGMAGRAAHEPGHRRL